MEKLNEVFKGLADKLHLPTFFKNNTLLFNNLFLLIVAVVVLIALLLVIFLVPGKKKKEKAAAAPEAPAPIAEPVSAEEESPVTEKEEPAPTLPEEKQEEAPASPEKEVEKDAEEQKAEETPEPSKPTAKKAPAKKEAGGATGKYEIVKRNGSFYFLLKANNGQLLLESTGYTTESGAKGGIETFKNAVENGEFRIDPDKNGNYQFILRANARTQMLYYGESYSTRQSAENAIGSVKNFASRAVIKRVEEDDVDDGTVVELKPLEESEHKTGGKYEIAARGETFVFMLFANNGQMLLESPAFTTEAGAKAGIETFKKAAESGVYSIDPDKNGKYRFILRAGTRAQGRYVGENYPTRQSAENSLNSVRAFAQKAVLK